MLAHDLASHAHRSTPNVHDFLAACDMEGLSVQELQRTQLAARDRDEQLRELDFEVVPLEIARQPPLEFMDPQDYPLVPLRDEDQADEERNMRLPFQPDFFPVLPPEHCWKQTPVSFLLSELSWMFAEEEHLRLTDLCRNSTNTIRAPFGSIARLSHSDYSLGRSFSAQPHSSYHHRVLQIRNDERKPA